MATIGGPEWGTELNQLMPDRRRKSRGQAMVETALVLPILLLLLLLALDFGRAFFGWVGLQNAARIGASYAAAHPLAWNTPGHPDQATYQAQMEADAAGINCALPSPFPEPIFRDGAVLGGQASVSMTCEFSVITPLMGNVVGDSITLNASSVFPIRTGCPGCPPPPAPVASGTPDPLPSPTASPAPTGPPAPAEDPCVTVPNLVGLSVQGARNQWAWSGFTGEFTPIPGQHETRTVTAQSTSPTTPPAPYNCLERDARITVTHDYPADPPDPACATFAYVPNVAGITVAEARAAWEAAGFTEVSFTPDATAGQDAMIVRTQTVGPTSVTAGTCVDPATATLVVTYGPQPQPPPPRCKVPSLIGIHTSAAEAEWASYDFTSKVVFEKKQELIPPGYTIQRQNLVADSWVPCDQNIKVGPQP